MERLGRVARAQARGSPARARLRGGALSGQVLAPARMVRRRRTRCRRRARRGANRAHGLLDGRCRLGRGRERADGRGGDRPRALDSRSARRVHAAREAARRVPRRARSLVPRHPRCVSIPFAERVRLARASAAPRVATSSFPAPCTGSRCARRGGSSSPCPRPTAGRSSWRRSFAASWTNPYAQNAARRSASSATSRADARSSRPKASQVTRPS